MKGSGKYVPKDSKYNRSWSKFYELKGELKLPATCCVQGCRCGPHHGAHVRGISSGQNRKSKGQFIVLTCVGHNPGNSSHTFKVKKGTVFVPVTKEEEKLKPTLFTGGGSDPKFNCALETYPHTSCSNVWLKKVEALLSEVRTLLNKIRTAPPKTTHTISDKWGLKAQKAAKEAAKIARAATRKTCFPSTKVKKMGAKAKAAEKYAKQALQAAEKRRSL